MQSYFLRVSVQARGVPGKTADLIKGLPKGQKVAILRDPPLPARRPDLEAGASRRRGRDSRQPEGAGQFACRRRWTRRSIDSHS